MVDVCISSAFHSDLPTSDYGGCGGMVLMVTVMMVLMVIGEVAASTTTLTLMIVLLMLAVQGEPDPNQCEICPRSTTYRNYSMIYTLFFLTDHRHGSVEQSAEFSQ